MALHLEVPKTEEAKTVGLMFRERLEWNSGMLFEYEKSEYRSFYMKNTVIPLDIAFIKEDGTIESIKELHPLDTTPVSSDEPVQYAIEVNRGWFEENGWGIGDRILQTELSESQILSDFAEAFKPMVSQETRRKQAKIKADEKAGAKRDIRN